MAKGAPQPPKQGGHPQAKAPKKLSYPTVIHPDLYQRANFTLQASAFLQQLNLESPSPDVVARKRKQDENELDETPRGSDSERLARNMMAANGKMVVHNQMKLDPSAKRDTCQNCSTVLIPGLTAKIRNRPNRYQMNVSHMTCLLCYAQSTIPLPPTSISTEESLDGRKRAKRRQQLANTRKVPFHQRESVSTNGDEPSTKGHTLYRKQDIIHNWGEISGSLSDNKDTSFEA